MDRLFTHTQFLSADASSPTVWRFSALCHLHQLCASVRRLCIKNHVFASLVKNLKCHLDPFGTTHNQHMVICNKAS